MKIRRFWPNHWSPDQTESFLPYQTLPKVQRTRRLSSSCQTNFLKSYHKFKHKSWSHLQNLDKASTKNLNLTSSPLNLKFKILTKPSFRISTKIQLRNLYKTPASKSCLNFKFKILINPCAQLTISEKKCFMTKAQLPNQQQTVANMILFINNSYNFNKFYKIHRHSLNTHNLAAWFLAT